MKNFFLVGRFLFKPLTDRFKLGEGGLALFNLTHSWFATHDFFVTVTCALISLLTLCALYGYNDYTDRRRDLQNPKKDKPFVQQINQQPHLFLWLNVALGVVLLLITYFALGKMQAAAMMLLFIINVAYSNKLKVIPGADITVVLAWGGVFTLLVPAMNYQLASLAAVMTGIAHLFQMLTDEKTDRLTKVNTTVVRFPGSSLAILISLTVVLSFALFFISLGNYVSISAVLPLLFYILIKQISVSWFFSRAYFAIAWLLLLSNIYGSV